VTTPSLARALAARDYNEPTPVQLAVLEEATQARDLLVSAQTGSGKTVAYGLAIAPTLLGDAEIFGYVSAPLALVVAPTRELALQVHRELSWLYSEARGRIASCVGGMDPSRERRALQQGAHIVVGTPGRLRDHIERGALNLSAIRAVVLDEADEMLDLGFRDDLEHILKAMPAEKRTLLFSATLPKGIVTLARDFQRDALRIEVGAGEQGHADIEHRAIRVLPHEIEHATVNLLRYHDPAGCIIFLNTREAVRHMQSALMERGFNAVALSGELSQNERNHALQSLRDGRARICVATDVAARGIDLPNLSLVIHADLPHDSEVLKHRSGRTGRAGRKGIAALLVPVSRRRKAERLLVDAGLVPEWSGPPSADDIRALDRERLLADDLFKEENTEDELAVARALLEGRSAEDIAAALVRSWRARLPAPEEITDPGFRQDPRPLRPNEPRREATGERREAAPMRHKGEGVWFRIDIGRRKSADPKWLLPVICKRGGVSRDAIGAIRIFDLETKFQVSSDQAEAFAAAMLTPGKPRKGEADMVFSRADGAQVEDKPAFKKKFDNKPGGFSKPPRGDFAKPPRGDFAKPPRGEFAKPPRGEFAKPPRGDFAKGPKPDFAKASKGDFAKPAQGDFAKPFKAGEGKPKFKKHRKGD